MCYYSTDDGKCRKFTDDKYTSYCLDFPCPDDTPTNADRIRSMSDEELAEIIAAEPIAEKIPFCKNKPECDAMLDADLEIPESMCAACVLDWLRQPAETEGTE